MNISLEDRVAAMFRDLQLPPARFTPYIYADYLMEERSALYLKHKSLNNSTFIYCDTIISPKALFEFLKLNSSARVVFEEDLLTKRKEYIDVIAGAICSNPNTVEPWKVSYGAESFVFKGSILVLSRLTKEELQGKVSLKYILRDSKVI